MTTKPEPTDVLAALSKHLERMIQDEADRIIVGTYALLEERVKKRLKDIVPVVRYRLRRDVFDFDVHIKIEIGGKPMDLPEPSQGILRSEKDEAS